MASSLFCQDTDALCIWQLRMKLSVQHHRCHTAPFPTLSHPGQLGHSLGFAHHQCPSSPVALHSGQEPGGLTPPLHAANHSNEEVGESSCGHMLEEVRTGQPSSYLEMSATGEERPGWRTTSWVDQPAGGGGWSSAAPVMPRWQLGMKLSDEAPISNPNYEIRSQWKYKLVYQNTKPISTAAPCKSNAFLSGQAFINFNSVLTTHFLCLKSTIHKSSTEMC